MARNKFRTADQAVAMIKDGDTVALIGGGGGLMEATYTFRAVSRRFLSTGYPRNLTVLHALGIGDKKTEGMNHFAHEGLVKRVIGGHWVWSPKMQEMARDEKIEAYVLPSGCVMQLYREIGGQRPGLFTHVGLGTFVDPRHQGGKMNASAKEDLVEVVNLGGQELLWYKSFPINVAIIRGSFGDADGNISLDQEAANVDVYAAALAAHNSGGIVIAQVKRITKEGSLKPHDVRVPGMLVDYIVVDPEQKQTTQTLYDPAISGEIFRPLDTFRVPEFNIQKVIARRVAQELETGSCVNLGFGISANVPRILLEEGLHGAITWVIEQGAVGGVPLLDFAFGCASNADAYMPSPYQFTYFQGAGFDASLLSFLEIGRDGSVNVSKLSFRPHVTAGAGGFVDITARAKKIVFSGMFNAGAKLSVADGKLVIDKEGKLKKLVNEVEHVTFSGPRGVAQGQDVTYVTERCVMKLTPDGVVLTEIAPGVDLQTYILDQSEFPLIVSDKLKVMDAALFHEEPMGLTLPQKPARKLEA